MPVEICYQFEQRRQSHKQINAGAISQVRAALPRITRLMALAIDLESRLRDCDDLDCRTVADVGCVSRPRITQVLNLLRLAPDIQECLLMLPPLARGREAITEKSIRQLSAEYDWERQRERFERLRRCRTARAQGGCVRQAKEPIGVEHD
jgi:hypothetical protein